MKKSIYILYVGMIFSACTMSSQTSMSVFDVQNLMSCYHAERDSGTHAEKKAYFDAFPSTFSEFKDVFGYEETNDGVIFGELYENSLEYITEFFLLNETIDPYEFSNKVIRLCINGEWQADGVNYLQTNVVNVMTSDINHNCYYNHFDVFSCYNDTMREAFLSSLTSLSNDTILSFWKFYLDGAEVVPIDNVLFKRTMVLIEQYPNLINQLEYAYTIVSQKRTSQEK